MTRHPWVLSIGLGLVVGACADAPEDRDVAGGGKADEFGASVLLDNADGENDHLRGVVRLNNAGGSSSCTGFLIDNGGGADAPAYLISNGHCALDWAESATTYAIAADVEPRADGKAIFDYFQDTPPVSIPLAQVRFATMKGVDLAVVELATTRAALAAQGIEPLPWAERLPEPGTAVSVVGAPLIGDGFLRRADCEDEGARAIMERNWRWHDIRRNRCADIVSGSSGSPVFDQDGAVYAVINTTTRDSTPDAACWQGAPCEIGKGGFATSPDTNYAVPVVGLAGCFGADGRFERTRIGCPLDPGAQLGISGAPYFRSRPEGTWGVTLAAAHGFTHYRDKSGRMGEVRCESPDGYGEPRPLDDQDLAARPLPTAEGPNVLCLLGGRESDGVWQDPAFATPIVVFVDTTAPTRRAELRVIEDPEYGLAVEPIFSPPELSHFEYAFGPAGATDCADPTLAYQPYRRFAFAIPPDVIPARLCLISEDVAGNRGAPRAYELP